MNDEIYVDDASSRRPSH